jgi:hypothetical protein
LAAAGCGSRTGLLVSDELPDGSPEAGLDASDATLPEDAGVDASPDVSEDRTVDADMDAEADVTVDAVADVVADVLPSIDVSRPRPVPCQEAGAAATLIYLVTSQSDLWSFYPPSLSFSRIGHLNCPTTDTPFSMAVDQAGVAYVLYRDMMNSGHLFRVSTATAGCQPTTFAPDQEQFQTFGMGYSQNPSGVGETLYIASDEGQDSGLPARLGLIDTTTFAVHTVGDFEPQLSSAELTGTGAAICTRSSQSTRTRPARPALDRPRRSARSTRRMGDCSVRRCFPTWRRGAAGPSRSGEATSTSSWRPRPGQSA